MHQNRSKIDAKRHSILDSIFWSMCAPILLPTSTPRIMKTTVFLRKNMLLKDRLSKLPSMFDPILVPTWLHSGIINRPNSHKKSIRGSIKKMIDFGDRFWESIQVRKGFGRHWFSGLLRFVFVARTRSSWWYEGNAFCRIARIFHGICSGCRCSLSCQQNV